MTPEVTPEVVPADITETIKTHKPHEITVATLESGASSDTTSTKYQNITVIYFG